MVTLLSATILIQRNVPTAYYCGWVCEWHVSLAFIDKEIHQNLSTLYTYANQKIQVSRVIILVLHFLKISWAVQKQPDQTQR